MRYEGFLTLRARPVAHVSLSMRGKSVFASKTFSALRTGKVLTGVSSLVADEVPFRREGFLAFRAGPLHDVRFPMCTKVAVPSKTSPAFGTRIAQRLFLTVALFIVRIESGF